MPKPPKRPADMMQLARHIGQIATGEQEREQPKPAAAAERGRARNAALSDEQKTEIARLGGVARAKSLRAAKRKGKKKGRPK